VLRGQTSSLFVVLILVSQSLDAQSSADQQQSALLPEGTPVRLAISRAVSSADAKKGDNIDFETLDDVRVASNVAVPKGSVAIGTITEARARRRMARGGKLRMNIDYLRLPSGAKLPLRGVQDLKGGSRTGLMVTGMVASVFFFPAAPLFLLVQGKNITIPKGQEVTVYTDAAYDPLSGKIGTGEYLTNADVLKLKQAGMGDELVIEKVKAAPGSYKLDPSDLVELKNSGLSDGIIAAMIEASRRNP